LASVFTVEETEDNFSTEAFIDMSSVKDVLLYKPWPLQRCRQVFG